MNTRLSYFLALLVLFATAEDGWSQHVATNVLQEDASGVRLEFVVTWPAPMQAALDSAGVSEFDVAAVAAVSRGVLDASEVIEIPRLGVPVVNIVEAAFDEVRLERGSGADSVMEALAGPLIEAGWPGISGGKALATARARLLSYDADARVLRRYRRLVVDVAYPEAAGKKGAALRASAAGNPHLSVNQSVLADGYLFKIPIRNEGIYELDAEYLRQALSQVGLSLGDVDPASIKLFGNGGRPLPVVNGAPRIADLVENPVQVEGSGSSLRVRFYARAPYGWMYDADRESWTHYTHPFSNENFYFLKIDSGRDDGRRLESMPALSGSNIPVFENVVGRHLKEYDEYMWSKVAGSGHTWVSKPIGADGRLDVYRSSPLPGFAGGDVRYEVRVAVRSNQATPRTTVSFLSGDAVAGTTTATPVNLTHSTSAIASAGQTSFTQAVSGNALDLTMRVERRPDGPQAALDWIRTFYPQELRAVDGQIRFATPPGESGVLEFALKGFSQRPVVWDVTAQEDVRAVHVTESGGGYRVRVDAPADSPRELLAFTDGAVRAPEAPQRIANQNLHGISSNPDFIIVTPDTFRVYAEELAQYRRGDGLTVEVADIQHIYNEFSGGQPDMRAVRDFFKFLYDRGTQAGQPLRYALLFGDGHYNFRGLGDKPQMQNWIFPYETEESFDPILSYTSDDYFGLLDDHEGEWPYRAQRTEDGERVDIGIGRFVVQTPEEARTVVDKIKQYESPTNTGPWRLRYTFVADDGWNGTSPHLEPTPDLHTQNIDVVAEQVVGDYPGINPRKIYGISYPRAFLTIWRQPEVRRDVLAAIDQGSLIVNYSGHGGESGLAQEQIFTRQDAAALNNADKLPVFITATCSFGRWDLSEEQSGAEVLLLNARGGAVALMTTVRLVFTSQSLEGLNTGLNLALNRALMQPDAEGLPRRLGDVMRITKNTHQGLDTNNRKFNLLGDPTMRLGLPAGRAVIETVNEQPVASEPVPIRALDRLTIRGSVRQTDGEIDEQFSGRVHLTVYDAERYINVPDAAAMRSGQYRVREDLIWRGEVQAQAGRYQATFVVPKDISYSNASGKISVYAESNQMQAGGYTQNVIVGGSSATPPDDSDGPSISLFLNDTTFVSGSLTNPTPELIVKLFDDSGINTVGAGVGHEMLLVLDGEEQNAANIGSYYEAEEDSYQRGTVRFPLDVYLRQQNREQLSPGPHTLEVRAWDVLNNSNISTLDFYVSHSEELALRNVLNYPNPLSRDTRFIFEHNKTAGTPARVQIRVYTLAGRPVRTLEGDETLPAGVLPGGPIDVYWDGRDQDFDPIGTGVYLYKVRVEVDTGSDREVVERIEKLAVIR